ncbi:hypothetical protein IX339_000090 [Porphyromonas levii]|nr:hypothetical protein [Porphyromonas levii]
MITNYTNYVTEMSEYKYIGDMAKISEKEKPMKLELKYLL